MTLQFERVSFQHSEFGVPALNEITFSAARGDRCVVGRRAGKSTLVKSWSAVCDQRRHDSLQRNSSSRVDLDLLREKSAL